MFRFLIALSFLISTTLSADFSEYFNVERADTKDGKTLRVYGKMGLGKLSFHSLEGDFLEMYDQHFDFESSEWKKRLSKDSKYQRKHSKEIHWIAKNLHKMNRKDLEGFFNDKEMERFFSPKLNELNSQFKNNLFRIVLSAPVEKNYFRKKALWTLFFEQMYKQLKKNLSHHPYANIAIGFIDFVYGQFTDLWRFEQNMLLSILSSGHHAKLGIRLSEVNSVLSSVYSSHISLLSQKEWKKAFGSWEKYGRTRYSQEGQASRRQQIRYMRNYEKWGDFISNSFVRGTHETRGNCIVNLRALRHSFSSFPAEARCEFGRDQMLIRSLAILAEMALKFSPVPNWIKGQAISFARSWHHDQRVSEGHLYGYFLNKENFEMISEFKRQSLLLFLP